MRLSSAPSGLSKVLSFSLDYLVMLSSPSHYSPTHSLRISSPYPSDRERVADVTTFLLAGHDTTGYQISWIVIEISRNPSVLQKIRSELDLLIPHNEPFTAQLLSQMKYLTMVIREGMRLWPVLPIGSNRVASRDIQYKEFVIPRGSTLGETCTDHDPSFQTIEDGSCASFLLFFSLHMITPSHPFSLLFLFCVFKR